MELMSHTGLSPTPGTLTGERTVSVGTDRIVTEEQNDVGTPYLWSYSGNASHSL